MRNGMGMGFAVGSGGGEPTVEFTFTGSATAGDTAGTLSLFFPASENGKVITASGDVRLGVAGNENTHTITGNATNAIKVWCDKGKTGKITLPKTYTRFSGNTSDDSPSDGWASVTSAPSISFSLTNIPSGLITFYCAGSNTISGTLPADWMSMKFFVCSGSNTISGDFPTDWKNMTYFFCTGSNAISGALPNDWEGMTYFYCSGTNAISGTLPADWKRMISFNCYGSNTISGVLPADWKEMTYFTCVGSNTISGIATGEITFATLNGSQYSIDPLTGGLSVADITRLLIGFSGKTGIWSAPKSISLPATNASMADANTTDNIWGDFSTGSPTPSSLADAVKYLVKTKAVTITLVGFNCVTGEGLPAAWKDNWVSWLG